MANRYVTTHPRGWVVKAPGSERASSVHSTQRDAERAAKQTVRNLGGGEVRIHGRDGRWRNSDNVPPAMTPTRRGTRSTEAELTSPRAQSENP